MSLSEVQHSRPVQPTQIEPLSPIELFVAWNNGEKYSVPYVEIRFYCPCASCIDENTGERTIVKSSISPDIRPTQVQVVGRYAIQFTWKDGHNTGMYHFDRLYELCQKQGRKL
jgi:DUF971 family protein